MYTTKANRRTRRVKTNKQNHTTVDFSIVISIVPHTFCSYIIYIILFSAHDYTQFLQFLCFSRFVPANTQLHTRDANIVLLGFSFRHIITYIIIEIVFVWRRVEAKAFSASISFIFCTSAAIIIAMQIRHVVGLMLLLAAVPLQMYLTKYSKDFRDLVSTIVSNLPQVSINVTGYVRATSK